MKDKLQKRKEADLRNKERAARSPKEQLARLDKMLGKGMGAYKERMKLEYLIKKER